MPVVVDLTQFAMKIGQPAPIYFQRRANGWLSGLRATARSQGVIPIQIGSSEYDIFDALRTEMNIRNGAALANMSLAKAILEAFPEGEIIVEERQGDLGVADAAAFIENGSKCRIRPQRRSRAFLSTLHVLAHNAKREFSLLREQKANEANFHIETGDAPILAIPRLPSDLADALPVAKHLRDEYAVDTFFGVVDDGMAKSIREAGFQAVHLLAWPGKKKKTSEVNARQVFAVMQQLLVGQAQAAASDSFCYAETSALTHVTLDVLERNLQYLFRVARAVECLVAERNPSLVFVSNPYTVEGKLATSIAHARSIPTASIEHGSIFPSDPIWQDCMIDLVCVGGEPSRRALLSCGLLDKQIAVTGSPRLDGVTGAALRKVHPSSLSSAANVLVATSGPGDQVSMEQHRSFIKILYEAAEMSPTVRWVVKLHKKDRSELYREIGAQFSSSSRVEIVSGERSSFGPDIFKFLSSAKALVTVCSTAALDAMVVGVPVISVAPASGGNGLQGIEFLERGCTRRVTDAQALADVVLRVWQDERLDEEQVATQYVAEHYANLGHAVEKTAKQLITLRAARLSHGR